MLTSAVFLVSLALSIHARSLSTLIDARTGNHAYTLLLGTYGRSVSSLEFNPSSRSDSLALRSVSVVADSPSWVEPAFVTGHKQKGQAFTLSETGGGIYSLQEQPDDSWQVTGSSNSNGQPAHLLALKDGSALVATNYGGGSATIIPLPLAAPHDHTSLPENTITFPYVNKPSKETAERQDASHAHQALEGPGGRIFVNDLGNDRVWVIGVGQQVEGWLQAPQGCGPRHGVFSANNDFYYLACELSSTLVIYRLPQTLQWDYPIRPRMHLEKGQPRLKTADWPLLPPGTSAKDISIAELISHPNYPETLYVSFRGQVTASNGAVKGDKIGIIQLGLQGDFVQDVKHLDTGLDFIRGMSISDDAKYLAATGQNAGGIEIYEISGSCGEILTLKAKLDVQGTEKGTSLAWV